MYIRMWRCCLMPGAGPQFDHFANTRLLTFFQQQAGCLGMSFFCRDSLVILLSYWQDLADPVRMEQSRHYTELVDVMRHQGWLLSVGPAEWVELSGGFLLKQAATQWQSAHQLAG